jgi:hypothetical protein
MSEAAMRETLLRSAEYATKNPARLSRAARRGRGAATKRHRPAPAQKKARTRKTR